VEHDTSGRIDGPDKMGISPSLTQWSARDTYGLDSKLLEDLGISGPLYYRVAVSNVS
jgi:hypothetical protein